MKRPLALTAIGMMALLAVTACHQRPTGSADATLTRLTSVSVQLPADDAQFPAGPHADAVNANCTACHSASMVLAQPPLTAEQWKAEVTKMRDVYKAPVPDAAVPDILAYLGAVSASEAKALETRPVASADASAQGAGGRSR